MVQRMESNYHFNTLFRFTVMEDYIGIPDKRVQFSKS